MTKFDKITLFTYHSIVALFPLGIMSYVTGDGRYAVWWYLCSALTGNMLAKAFKIIGIGPKE